MLEKLHAELLALESRFHSLVDPEAVISAKVREIVKQLVLDMQGIKAHVGLVAAPSAVVDEALAPTVIPRGALAATESPAAAPEAQLVSPSSTEASQVTSGPGT